MVFREVEGAVNLADELVLLRLWRSVVELGFFGDSTFKLPKVVAALLISFPNRVLFGLVEPVK